jgi:hypothetical protein
MKYLDKPPLVHLAFIKARQMQADMAHVVPTRTLLR